MLHLPKLYPKKGFTLIELIVAITIVSIISSVGFVTYSNSQIIGRDGRRKQDLRAVKTALELYYYKNKTYPLTGSLGTLVPNYINTIPSDPKNGSYNFTSDGTTYALCTKLENTQDKEITTYGAFCPSPSNWGVNNL